MSRYKKNLKRNNTNELTKQKETHRLKRMKLRLLGEDVGGDSQGVWGGHVHTAVFKMDNHKNLLYSTENSAQCMQQPGWERSLGENKYMYMYG